jgi:hypothetical protein
MNTRLLGCAAVLALSISHGVIAQAAIPTADQAQTATSSVGANPVGHWLYDPAGHLIGSVRNLTDGGRTVVIMVGSYFQPGNHEAQVPARALSIVNGRAMLQTETVKALNTPPGR